MSPPVRTLDAAPAADRDASPRPGTQRRVRREPGLPLEPRDGRPRRRQLGVRELGEVLRGQRFDVAPRRHVDRVVARLDAGGVGLGFEQAGRLAGGRAIRGRADPVRAPPRPPAPRRGRGARTRRRRDRRSRGPRDGARAASRSTWNTSSRRPRSTYGERLDDVEHPAGVHVETEPAQQPLEAEQPRQQRVARAGGHASCAARAWRARAARRCARRASRPRLRAPSARRRACPRWRPRSRARAASATSAAAQSIVSDTPGTLYRSCVRSSCASAVTWAESCADASGTRTRTIASSFSKLGILEPLIQAAALQRVVHLAGAVRGEDDQRALRRRARCRFRGSSPGTRPAAPAGSLRTPRRRDRSRR